jgi:hypothetical protein
MPLQSLKGQLRQHPIVYWQSAWSSSQLVGRSGIQSGQTFGERRNPVLEPINPTLTLIGSEAERNMLRNEKRIEVNAGHQKTLTMRLDHCKITFFVVFILCGR